MFIWLPIFVSQMFDVEQPSAPGPSLGDAFHGFLGHFLDWSNLPRSVKKRVDGKTAYIGSVVTNGIELKIKLSVLLAAHPAIPNRAALAERGYEAVTAKGLGTVNLDDVVKEHVEAQIERQRLALGRHFEIANYFDPAAEQLCRNRKEDAARAGQEAAAEVDEDAIRAGPQRCGVANGVVEEA